MENTTTIMETLSVNEDFAKLLERAKEIQSKCNDYLVDADSITMGNDLNLNFDGMSLPMSPLATGHLCGKLQVPSRYFDRLVQSGAKSLAADNINRWLTDDRRALFLRAYEGTIRGVLSGSYSVYDAPEILATVDEVFDSTKFKLKGSFINEERLHIRLVEDEMLPIDGEDLFAGITIDSSDVGRSGLAARFFIYKQVCTNGLVIAKSSAKLFTQKHIGITSENFAAGLKEGLERFYDIKDEVTEMIKETAKIPVSSDMDELIEQIKTKTALSDESVDEVIYMMDTKYAHNLWGMINGITEVAQQYSLERRLQLEEIAGSMLANA